MMTLNKVLPMLLNGATVDDVLRLIENRPPHAEVVRLSSNVVSFAEARARARLNPQRKPR